MVRFRPCRCEPPPSASPTPSGRWSSARRSARASAPPSSSATRRSCAPPTRWASAGIPTSSPRSGARQAVPAGEHVPNGAERRQALLDAAAAARDPERVGALEATGLLDSDVDPAFDRHARLAAQVLNAPVALVSLVDADRQFFKSCLGLPEPWASQRGTPLSHSFCQHAVASREPLIVDDAREHAVLRDNPAIRDMGVVAYAGIPLIDAEGNALGTLCVIDSQPRHWTTHQVQLLADLAASVVTEITLARQARETPPLRSAG